MKSYRIKLQGRVSGPFPENEIERMFARGSINIGTLCQREGMSDWRDLDEILPLLKYLASDSKRAPTETLPWKNPEPSAAPWIVGISVVGAFTGMLVFLFLSNMDPARSRFSATLDTPTIASTPQQPTAPGLGNNLVLNTPSAPRSMTSSAVDAPPVTVTPAIQPAPQIIVQQPAVATEPALEERRRKKEFQVPIYEKINMANYGGPDIWCRITDDTPSAIFIQWGGDGPYGQRPQRYEKVTGFEGNDYTPILPVVGGRLYFIDSLRATPGMRLFVVD